jgi:hypothetical protein
MSGFRHACLSFFRLHRDHPATKLTGAAAILTMALPMPWMLRSKRPQAGRQTKQERRACSHASGELSWVREDRRSPRFHALPLRSRITWCGKRMAQWATFLYVLSWKWCDHLRLGVGAGVVVFMLMPASPLGLSFYFLQKILPGSLSRFPVHTTYTPQYYNADGNTLLIWYHDDI